MTDARTDHAAVVRFAGRVGWATSIALAAILASHPLGTTSLYADGEAFLEHVGSFWVVIHIAATLLLTAYVPVLWAWAGTLQNPTARYLGRWAGAAAAIGMGVGAIHMLATDTTTFVMFRDTFESGNGSEPATIAVDLLLRLHAATLTAWVTSFWFLVPALIAWASHREGLPTWTAALAAFSAACQAAALTITFAERQWTTLSETVVFRTGATALLVWFLVTTWSMKRTDISVAEESVRA